ncbi:hypothetical protein V6M85_02650 [Sulfolobus tengchongensis]|uniref:Metallopeptidase n=1 Tax=Sulfolobus tengchongensis TaxID=207809 RepID=A0AAX4L272_9CREN
MPSFGMISDIVLNDVREDLKRKLGREIPNVTIEFVNYLPPQVLAYVRANEYTIYVNYQQYMRAKNMGYEYDYLYVILLHEYLHIIGIADEREVRRIDLEIVKDKFGEDSIAYKLALNLADPRDVYLNESQRLGGKPNTFM